METDKELVTLAHAENMFVIAYTLIDPATMLEIIDKGVDGIETDYPGVARALLPPGDLPRFIRR